jgi:hypothetical protein
MTGKRFCFFFLLIAFLSISNSGWAGGIVNDVSVTPANPTTEDSVTVIISGALASTLDSACFEDVVKRDEGQGNHRIVIYLSHVEHVDVDLRTPLDFRIEVPLGQLEEGLCELSVVTQHTLLASPPLVHSTLDALIYFAVSCGCTSSVSEEEILELAQFALSQNYPNPFNQTTSIGFTLSRSGFVSLDIYDILGRKVRNLVSENMSSGYNSVLWDGTNDSGQDVASGIYFYQVKAGDSSDTRRLVLLK